MTESSTTNPVKNMTRKDLKELRGECLHAARSSGQADLYLLKAEAEGWVLKDFIKRPLWIRVFVSWRSLAREVRALKGLQGIDGVPRFGCKIDKDAFVMERLAAKRLPHRREYIPSAQTFKALENLIEEMHAAGWAHGDLRRKNILVDDKGSPYLIDFATAINAKAGPISRFIYKRMSVVDRVNIARIKKAYSEDLLNESERELLSHQPLHLRTGRFIRKKIYRPLKRKHRRETLRAIAGKICFWR